VTVALGVAGAGIAFALQEVIVSFAGWLNIMLSNQITVGQRVKIGEISGDIIDIGVLKTTIMEIGAWVDGDLYNGRITSISNNFMFSTPIQNYSSDYPFLWDEIQVPLRLESDQQSARALFTKIASEVCGDFANRSVPIWNQMKGKYLIEKASVDPMIFMKFDQNWMTFTLRYVVDFRQRRSTKDVLFSRIIDEIKKHDDIIMIASSTLEVTNLYKDDSDKNEHTSS
jgi:small-conductance mechanosensitive channel